DLRDFVIGVIKTLSLDDHRVLPSQESPARAVVARGFEFDKAEEIRSDVPANRGAILIVGHEHPSEALLLEAQGRHANTRSPSSANDNTETTDEPSAAHRGQPLTRRK